MIERQQNLPLLTALANAAFQRVAIKVIERAQQTDTPVITWKDGKVYEIIGDELDRLLEEVLAKQSHETGP